MKHCVNIDIHSLQPSLSPQLTTYELDVSPDSRWVIPLYSQKIHPHFVYMQEGGEFWARKNYFTRRSGLRSYMMVFTTSGSGTLTYDGTTHALEPGDLFWIDCSRSHEFRTAPDQQNWHMVWINFWGGNAESYYSQMMEITENCPVIATPPCSGIPNRIREITDAYRVNLNHLETDITISARLTTLMAEAISAAIAESSPMLYAENAPDYVVQAYEFLTKNYMHRPTLDTIADLCSVNKFYLQKQFKLYTGRTPNELQNILLIGAAKSLLRKSATPVNEIAASLGFDNVSYFIRLFKKIEGVTPYKYRANWAKTS